MDNNVRYSAMTAAERLAVVNDAIYQIMVGGQSYSIGSRSLTRADLSKLQSERDALQAQVSGSNAGLIAGVSAAQFSGR